MSEAGAFIDAALQNEGSRERAFAARGLNGQSLRFYGSPVGAVRGTVRDAARKFPALSRDDITALSSELWAKPVFERRLAAIVLLQSNIRSLHAHDLTRIEGFVRTAGDSDELLGQLINEVVVPLFAQLDVRDRARTAVVLRRWLAADHPALRRAARSIPTL